MIKTGLEHELEIALSAIGMDLRDRVYKEDVKIISDAYDLTNQSKVPSTQIGRLIAELNNKISSEQGEIYDNLNPAISRSSTKLGGYSVTYSVRFNDQLENYRNESDRLIKEAKIGVEQITIDDIKEDGLIGIDIFYDNPHGNPRVEVNGIGRDQGSKYDILRNLINSPYDRKEIVGAVVKFIRS